MKRETLLDFFESLAGINQEFLVHYDGYRTRTVTYAELAAASRAFAVRLHHAGLRKGDRILIWSENRPEWIVALWGALLQGIVLVPVDYRASWTLLARIHAAAGAKLLLAGDDVVTAEDLGIPVWLLRDIDWNAAEEEIAPADIKRDDIAEILFTSGATAEPKGVIIQHRNILANMIPVEKEIMKHRKWGKPFFPIRFLNLLPLSHMFGQAMATFIPPMLPGVVVFMAGYNPHDIVKQIRTRRVSVLVCVPKILEVLRDYILRAAPEAAEPPKEGSRWISRWWKYRRVHRLLGWKFWSFVVGAAPLDPELEAFWSGLGYVVIQGYGLTETAPIVTLNHPFHARRGSVGKAIGGVEIKLADDGEILVRGENVTPGYFGSDGDSGAFKDGWLHTGDVGEIDATGQVFIRGRKKEMIVTPEGLNVFPEDVERVLNVQPGVRDSAVVGKDRVHAVLVLDNGADPAAIVGRVNSTLEDHQRIRGWSVWPHKELPRTEGTRKLKRRELFDWVSGGAGPAAPSADPLEATLARFVRGRTIGKQTSVEELGLSSLERVELLMELERTTGVSMDEAAYSGARTVEDLRRLIEQPVPAAPAEPVKLPRWNRSWWAQAIRRVNLPLWLLPLARIFLHVRASGLEHLRGLEPPVIFAPTHQSHLDVPALMLALPAKWRYRVTPAMSKEFFDAHFYPQRHTAGERFTNGLNYYLACLLFNAFPLPQREAGARQTLRYAGELASERWCITIFPEGRITDTGEIGAFQPGVALLASKLRVPVVPVRLSGLDKILHRTWKMARPGRVEVRFGKPLYLEGEDYAALARQVEEAVRAL